MSSEFQLDMYKKDVMNQFKNKGIDSIGEFCACYMIPLIDAYTIIRDNVLDYDIKRECDFKIKRLAEFYSSKF